MAHNALRPDTPTKLAKSTSNKASKPTKPSKSKRSLSLLEWAEVAAQVTAQVGTKVTNTQCQNRWVHRLKFQVQGLRMGVEFTPAEVSVCIASFAFVRVLCIKLYDARVLPVVDNFILYLLVF